jgi:hypothetical protein
VHKELLIKPSETAGYWDCECTDGDHRSPERVAETYHPVLQISLREYNRLPLTEMTYRELAAAIDPTFLSQGIRSKALTGIKYIGFQGDTMQFRVNSSEFEKNDTWYMSEVKFDEWEDVGQDTDLTPIEKARLLLWVGNIRINCTDPSFLYWGYQYILTQFNSAIYPEDRPPVVRNPGLKGIVCKHLNRILKVLPFYSGDIAKEISLQFGGDLDKTAKGMISRREKAEAALNPEGDTPTGEM